MKNLTKYLVLTLILGFGLVACEPEAEEAAGDAGAVVEDTAEDVGGAVEDTAEDAEGAVEDTAEDVGVTDEGE